MECTVPNQIYDSSSQTCVCKSGYHYYSIYNMCHEECQSGYYFDTLSMKCVAISLPCGQNMQKTLDNQCVCFAGYLLRTDGKSCRFNCTEDFVYDAQTDTCIRKQITCPTGSSYNVNTQQC